jgi:hypothetical protein
MENVRSRCCLWGLLGTWTRAVGHSFNTIQFRCASLLTKEHIILFIRLLLILYRRRHVNLALVLRRDTRIVRFNVGGKLTTRSSFWTMDNARTTLAFLTEQAVAAAEFIKIALTAVYCKVAIIGRNLSRGWKTCPRSSILHASFNKPDRLFFALNCGGAGSRRFFSFYSIVGPSKVRRSVGGRFFINWNDTTHLYI